MNFHIIVLCLLFPLVYATNKSSVDHFHDALPQVFISQFIDPVNELTVRRRSSTSENATHSNVLSTSLLDIKINVGDVGIFSFELEDYPKENITVSFVCQVHCSTFAGLNSTVVLGPNRKKASANFTVLYPGHDIIELHVTGNSEPINVDNAFVRIRVGRSSFLTILGFVFGWIYFVTWSASFWPQNFTNYRRYSVVGLSFDYTILHFTGFIFYSIFNCVLFWSTHVQKEYEARYPRSEIPVELNDVVYALHAAFTTAITWYQCMTYPSGDQRLALPSKLYQGAIWTVGTALAVTATLNVTKWLDFIYFFSYVKLSVTALKYLPQLYFNYSRKSTQGWSIIMIYLDISGGTMSMLQMLTIAYNYDDWVTLIGNLPKLGLAIASMFYDVIFLMQEFIFYPGTNRATPDANQVKLDNISHRSPLKSCSVKSGMTSNYGTSPPNKFDKINNNNDSI